MVLSVLYLFDLPQVKLSHLEKAVILDEVKGKVFE